MLTRGSADLHGGEFADERSGFLPAARDAKQTLLQSQLNAGNQVPFRNTEVQIATARFALSACDSYRGKVAAEASLAKHIDDNRRPAPTPVASTARAHLP